MWFEKLTPEVQKTLITTSSFFILVIIAIIIFAIVFAYVNTHDVKTETNNNEQIKNELKRLQTQHNNLYSLYVEFIKDNNGISKSNVLRATVSYMQCHNGETDTVLNFAAYLLGMTKEDVMTEIYKETQK